ncbi:septal ring lytic transglycosylase RlpA family protein [Aquabacterium lacunae]|uniref:Endolytic peptidoglycan transglycosylase RlpA n=1 Tax=Aquabacterium lacunae TaxID=2528630 RepID=A0A4Q9GWC2_9BURK|nr:septal ring lytic transglycosylase RlpA family protein [Aquabacterium lacunae]TBO29335.1 septal ring lytic transglycosylase RlpA family protein [Aquabacterium lacunae]
MLRAALSLVRLPALGRVAAWTLSGVLVSLAGCSTVPLPPAEPVARPSAKAENDRPAPPVVRPDVRPERDGAPDRPPEDLASVPDAVPRIEPILPRGPNKPYTVLGQDYEPMAADVPYKEKGTASWYGTKFHGRRTASGEVYSMYGMTAAHRTLPIPSYVRVRNPANDKAVIVRVNDRGPFHASRVLDLSYTAAARLELLARGHGEVEIERITFEDIRTGRWVGPGADGGSEPAMVPPRVAGVSAQPGNLGMTASAVGGDPIEALASRLDAARPAPVASPAEPVSAPLSATESVAGGAVSAPARARAFTPHQEGFWVQLAAFSQRAGVDAFQKRVATELSHLAPLLAVFQEGPGYRLQVGPYARRDEAHGIAQRVREALRLSPIVVERR